MPMKNGKNNNTIAIVREEGYFRIYAAEGMWVVPYKNVDTLASESKNVLSMMYTQGFTTHRTYAVNGRIRLWFCNAASLSSAMKIAAALVPIESIGAWYAQ